MFPLIPLNGSEYVVNLTASETQKVTLLTTQMSVKPKETTISIEVSFENPRRAAMTFHVLHLAF